MTADTGHPSQPDPVLTGCLTGTFTHHCRTQELIWSDEMFRIHGYVPGDVVPTFDVFFSHVPCEDRPIIIRMREEVRSGAGTVTRFHTIKDARGRIHHVLTLARAHHDSNGKILTVEGSMTDLTRTLRTASQALADEAVKRATSHRQDIEQAKGILMGHFRIPPETAFALLSKASQRTNTKLAEMAEEFVRTASALGSPAAVESLATRSAQSIT